MGLEKKKMFHIYADGKTIKELTEKEYLKNLERKDWMIGWVDAHHFLVTKGDKQIYLSRSTIQKIFGLFDNSKET